MTYAPQSLKDLMALWTSNGGVNLGIVGDVAHQQKGTSYHLGRDDLVSGAYSARLPRDVAGLTDAASAVDLGKLGGSLAGLQKFSVWLAGQCKAGAPGTRDIRELIYSPDGKVVRRWDDVSKATYTGGDGTGQGDNTHLYHTHISYYRDSEGRDKTVTFRPYFQEAEMPQMFRLAGGAEYPSSVKLAPGYKLYEAPSSSAKVAVMDNDRSGATLPSVGWVPGGDWLVVAYNVPAGWPYQAGSWAMYVPKASMVGESIDNPRLPVTATSALEAEIASLKTRLATAEGAVITASDSGYNEGLATSETAIHALPRR
jgi:hypothetical protein